MQDFENMDESPNESDNFETGTNAGWVNSVEKVLKIHKPKAKKVLVLSKAKTLNKEETKETINPIAPSDKQKKKKDLHSIRVKPVSLLDKSRERNLQKIATKGIVQLFNVVRLQQKDVNKKLESAGPLEVKKEKALKGINKQVFLDVLMGESVKNATNSTDITNSKQIKINENEMWAPLRSDFMIDAKLKDWDKDINYEEEIETA